jgi:hypothetical protein
MPRAKNNDPIFRVTLLQVQSPSVVRIGLKMQALLNSITGNDDTVATEKRAALWGAWNKTTLYKHGSFTSASTEESLIKNSRILSKTPYT